MNNWKLHFWYMLAFAVFLLITIITYWLGGKGNDIVSYVSFASGLISIVLALVAIFYSIIQNTSSQQNLGEMKTLIGQASALISEKAGAMTEEAKAMREGLALVGKLQPVVGGESNPLKGHLFHLDISRSRDLSLLFLYCIGKSCEHHKRVSLEEIITRIFKFTTPHTKSAGTIAIIYLVAGLECFFEDGSIVFHESDVIEVKKLPANFTEYVLDEIKKRMYKPSATSETKTYYQDIVKTIDDYFKS